MNNQSKQLSNPFSTGGGGELFEAYVDASFVVLMLAGGYAPCITNIPIKKIKLQGRFAGYNTDDMIIFLEKEKVNQEFKVLCQIKNSICISENNKIFNNVVQAAWKDFTNPKNFSKNKDAIALITGPLSATDIHDTRVILEWARFAENDEEFMNMVKLSNLSSDKKRTKLLAFQHSLQIANNNIPISQKDLFEFLKHFYLLGYDLDIKNGVFLSLLHSLIGQYSSDNVNFIWTNIVDEVQNSKKNAGTITTENLPDEIRQPFQVKVKEIIPNEYIPEQSKTITHDWNHHAYASDLIIAGLIGAWDEKNKDDLGILNQLVQGNYESWIIKIQEIIQQPDNPIILKNGVWYVTKRDELFQSLGSRVFDNTLEELMKCIISVLTKCDPEFSLSSEEHVIQSTHNEGVRYSPALKRGLAESLALIGNQPDVFIYATQFLPEYSVVQTIRNILCDADWKLWGSLNNYLPILAEAAPEEFLCNIEIVLQKNPCPFDKLFSTVNDGIFSPNYLTGLVLALETLAWDEEFLIRAVVILGKLANRTFERILDNEYINSLTMIFLPWHPQTNATIEKREVAIKTLQNEFPDVTWKLLLSLLPNQHQISTGTRIPVWRKIIPHQEKVTKKEYLDQVTTYSDLAINMSSQDNKKLIELVGYLDSLPQTSLNKLIDNLSSVTTINISEDEKLVLWEKLKQFTTKHRRFSDTDWALDSEVLSHIESVTSKLAPSNPLNLYHRLFNANFIDLYEENENWENQEQLLEKHRQQAIREILAYGDVCAILQFVKLVESPSIVGNLLSTIVDRKIENMILPGLLDNEDEKIKQFVSGFIFQKNQECGWEWVDTVDRGSWTIRQIGEFLSDLPFTEKTWKRATLWLDQFESEYWIHTKVNPFQTQCDLTIAIEKLINYGRPHAAISCLYKIKLDKQLVDKRLCKRALLAAKTSTEPTYANDEYYSVELIKALQNDLETNPEDLFQIEWEYLSILNQHNRASPKLLEFRLATDPDFFCKVIQIAYRSKKDGKQNIKQNEYDETMASEAWELIYKWRTPPGTHRDGTFSQDEFSDWLQKVREICTKSGHLEIAFTHIGKVLYYLGPDADDLFIHRPVAEVLNQVDTEEMRNGYINEAIDARGVHEIDPSGEPERVLAKQYRQEADDIENAGYYRFAESLRYLAKSYENEAKKIINEYKKE
jgi:hypothetical protein